MDTRKRQGSLLNYVQKKIALENEVETAVVTVDLEGDNEVSSVIPQKEDPRINLPIYYLEHLSSFPRPCKQKT